MIITVKDVCSALEELAPLSLQESYDNAGLLVGNKQMPLTGVLLCIDVTEEIIEEAVRKKCNMIVSHHPLIFRELKSLTGEDYVERSVLMAIKNDIAIYAAHTNLDNISGGVNTRIAEKLGLKNIQLLQPANDKLIKLVTFVPNAHVVDVRTALFEAGAGHIGKYDCCSYSVHGEGTFRAGDECNPYIGKKGEMHIENEVRIEVILPSYLKNKVYKSLIKVHPYEEPAIDLIPLENNSQHIGIGVVGELSTPEEELSFLHRVKQVFGLKTLKYTALLHRPINKVALCGGSGSSLIKKAISVDADVYLSADFKYHDFFLAEKRILIADIGHFESEQFTKEIFFEQLTKKIPTFAIHFSEISTNPINYL
jgi:dinuclear metal center YbgI/SA1388 family protein